MEFWVEAFVETINTFRIKVNIDLFQIRVANMEVKFIYLSLVAFDSNNFGGSIVQSPIHSIHNLTVYASENYILHPMDFQRTTLAGLSGLSLAQEDCGIDFNWQFDLPNSRIIVNKSSNQYSGVAYDCPLQNVLFSNFYIRSVTCPSSHPFYNSGTNMCDNFCSPYNYANLTAKVCQSCNFACYTCTGGVASGCTACNPADNRVLVGI